MGLLLASIPHTFLRVAEGDPVAEVSPDTLTIAGRRGATHQRTLLLRLPPEVSVVDVVAEDLVTGDGVAVLPSASITAAWPKPDVDATQPDGADEADASAAGPQPLVVTVNLNGVESGQYSGKLYVVTDSVGELPVVMSVAVKSIRFWPLVVLAAGLGLGMTMSHYRKRGRRRDELLVEAGDLRNSIDGDEYLAPDAAGAVFYQRLDNGLYDAQIAMRIADWESAAAALKGVRDLYGKWVKDQRNWIAQLKAAERLRSELEKDDGIAYFEDVAAKLATVVRTAPEEADASTLQTELAALPPLVRKYREAEARLLYLGKLVQQLPNRLEGERKRRREYEQKLVLYTRELQFFRPTSDPGFVAAYDALGAQTDERRPSTRRASGQAVVCAQQSRRRQDRRRWRHAGCRCRPARAGL